MEMTHSAGCPAPTPSRAVPCSCPQRGVQTGVSGSNQVCEGSRVRLYLQFVSFYRLQQLNSWLLCWFQSFYESVQMKINVHITMMKLGLFLFLQLKDGTLISGTSAPWSTSQALCVWPLRMRRGRSHQSSYHARGTATGGQCMDRAPLGPSARPPPYIMKLNIKPLLGWGLLFFP